MGGPAGHFVTRFKKDLEFEAFVPHDIPLFSVQDLSQEELRLHDEAMRSLARLDGMSSKLPDIGFFVYMHVRKEAVLSSLIEGTKSTLQDLLFFEMSIDVQVPIDDVTETSNYVEALFHGRDYLEANGRVSAGFFRQMHEILLRSGRGSRFFPGEFRQTQNWIGGLSPAKSDFVPPPPEMVPGLIEHLVEYIEDDRYISPLIRVGMAHAYFETVHPFADGNGRCGRILIPMLLQKYNCLHNPVLYISLFFKENRSQYYSLLQEVRYQSAFNKWLTFFFNAITESSEKAILLISSLQKMFASHREMILKLGRKGRSALAVFEEFAAKPVYSISFLNDKVNLTKPTIYNAVKLLCELGILEEVTGFGRNRIYCYRSYLSKLQEY